MTGPAVLIFHRPATAQDGLLVRQLAAVREELIERQAALFRRAGSGVVDVMREWRPEGTWGDALREHAPRRGGLIVLGSGAVPLLNLADAQRLVAAAASGDRRAVTNNRYSSDVCAIPRPAELRHLPPLASDNALPRWLEERAGFTVEELPARARLGMDLDSPLDVALVALHARAPAWLRRTADDAALRVPRIDELRALTRDRRRELLVFGRSGSDSLRWLEANVQCRVRFLAEERGLRGGAGVDPRQRPASATLGLLLASRGAGRFADMVAELADGAVIDTRVLIAHRNGVDEADWPPPADRFASDLLLPTEVSDPWLRELTAAAAGSRGPIVLGAHTLVGPGLATLLGGAHHGGGRAGHRDDWPSTAQAARRRLCRSGLGH